MMGTSGDDDRSREFEIGETLRGLLIDHWRREEATHCDHSDFERIKAKAGARTRGRWTDRLGLPLVHAVETLRQSNADSVLQAIEKCLGRKVAMLAEQFRATAAWLYIVEEDDLVARIAHNTTARTFRKARKDNGVVPHVAESKQGECIDDVQSCVYYDPGIAETQSELCVPILTLRIDGEDHDQSVHNLDNWEVLAVLNLESDAPSRFSQKDVAKLHDAATVLVGDLICWASIKENAAGAWAWHPQADGWTCIPMLDDICHEVSQSLDDRTSTVSAAIWHTDWSNQVIHVRGTSGFDYEYKTKTLPLKSYTGSVSRRPKGTVVEGSPYDEVFIRQDKAEDMGLSEIMSVPYFASDAGESEPALGTINLYLFDNSPVSAIPLRQEMTELARHVGAAITSFEAVRRKVVCACVANQVMHLATADSDTIQSHSSAAQITELLKECFQAEECSICIVGQEGLVSDESSDLTSAARCDIQEEVLARHPGSCIRDTEARCVGNEASGGPQHRRFLGISFFQRDKTVAVIKLVRSATSCHFTEFDEVVLRDIARLCDRYAIIVQGLASTGKEDASGAERSNVGQDDTRSPYVYFGSGFNVTDRCLGHRPGGDDLPFALAQCSTTRELLGWFYRLGRPLGIKNVRYHFLSPWDERLVSVECCGHSDGVAAGIRAGRIVKTKKTAKLDEYDSYWAFQLHRPVVFQLDERVCGVLPLDYIDNAIPCFVVGRNQCENILKGKRLWVDIPMSVGRREIGKLSCGLSAASLSDINSHDIMDLWNLSQSIAPYIAYMDQIGGPLFESLRDIVFDSESVPILTSRLAEQLSKFEPPCDRYVSLFTMDRSQEQLVLAGSSGGILSDSGYSLQDSLNPDYPAPWVAKTWRSGVRQSLRLQGLSRSDSWRAQASSQGASVKWPDPCFGDSAPENLLTVGVPGVGTKVLGVLQLWDCRKPADGEQSSLSDADQRVVERLARECIGARLLCC